MNCGYIFSSILARSTVSPASCVLDVCRSLVPMERRQHLLTWTSTKAAIPRRTAVRWLAPRPPDRQNRFMEPDEVWAYRARAVDDLTPVRVLRHGTKKPARVLVHFEDPSMEGREEWVPPARLKVPWDEADAYLAREAQWAAVLALAGPRDSPEVDAACEVFGLLVDPLIADPDWRGTHIRISDVSQLAQLCGIPPTDLTADPVGFSGDSEYIASWPLVLKIARALAAQHASRVLSYVAQKERKYQHEAIHGRQYPGRNGIYLDPDLVREFDEEHGAPRRALLRQWCGHEAEARHDELIELRKEIRRVGTIAERAITELRSAGKHAAADRIEHDLGQTVDMLRPGPGPGPAED